MTHNTPSGRGESKATAESSTDERGTPARIIRTLQGALGGQFDLDPAAGAEPIPIADRTYTKADNGLAQPWDADTVWLNPPYSDPLPWMRKLTRELDRQHGSPRLALVLVKADPTTTWFADHLATVADYVSLIDHRLSFHGADSTAPFGNILAACGDVTDPVLEALDDLGTVYRRETISGAAAQSRLSDLMSDGGTATHHAATTSTRPTSDVSFDRLQPRDRLRVTFDPDRLGTIHGLPDATTVRVLPTGPEFDPESGEVRVDCLGANALADDRDLYLQLRERAYATTRTEVAVSVDGRPWELSSVDTVATATTEVPADV